MQKEIDKNGGITPTGTVLTIESSSTAATPEVNYTYWDVTGTYREETNVLSVDSVDISKPFEVGGICRKMLYGPSGTTWMWIDTDWSLYSDNNLIKYTPNSHTFQYIN